MADPESEENVFRFRDDQPGSDPVHEYTDALRNNKAAIIIDNGSYKCRAGWVTDDKPRLVFKNVVARQRSKKEADVLIGNDIRNLEVVRWQLKAQFDRGIVTQYDIQEQVFDYIFTHLGVDTVGSVDHPVVMTEPLCNPNYCRHQMSELLFECYHVPSVMFGVDALFSLQHNQPNKASMDALIVSCGYYTTHVLPILGGHLQADHSRRINIGGHHMDSFMQRLLQLKYPSHFAALTLSRAEELMHRHTYMARDYIAELNEWAQEDYFFGNVHKMQLPFTAPPTGASQTAEQQKERREQQGRRLKDLNAKRREAKLAVEQERLQQLLNLDEMAEEDGEGEEFQKSLSTFGYVSQSELQAAILKLNNTILRMRQKMESEDGEVRADQSSDQSRDPKSADFAAVVKKQDIGYIPPGTKMEDWLVGIRKRREDIISSRIERRQRRSEMTKRRTLASQQRMKIITSLAQGTKRKKEDTFGQNDDDWNIYKEISKDAGNSDSEAEQEQLDELEMILRERDPEFVDPNQQESTTFDIAEYYKLYIGIERIRVPELMLQPSMVGVEQAGLTDTIDFILHKFTTDEQRRLVQNVFLTGGCSSIPLLKERMESDLRAIRPFQSTFAVQVATDPVLGAWHGARQVARSDAFAACCIHLADYEEMGAEYLKEHFASNRYARTPVLVAPTT